MTTDKAEIRELMKKKRAGMSGLEVIAYSRIIENRLLDEAFFKEADCILAYVDCKNEVSTRAIINAAFDMGKRVAVPKVSGKEMGFYYIKSFADLKKGYQGIYEPEFADDTNLCSEKNALCIVPGVAFDRQFNRIGYGGGFYDRFFAETPEVLKCALCFDSQLVDRIDTDPFDKRVDIIITPSEVLKKN